MLNKVLSVTELSMQRDVSVTPARFGQSRCRGKGDNSLSRSMFWAWCYSSRKDTGIRTDIIAQYLRNQFLGEQVSISIGLPDSIHIG